MAKHNGAARQEEIEVDFYRNPTPLCTSIIVKDYKLARIRVQQHPDEASTWICIRKPTQVKTPRGNTKKAIASSKGARYLQKIRAKDAAMAGSSDEGSVDSQSGSSSDNYTLRRLPIHMALGMIPNSSGDATDELESLIVLLAESNPYTCMKRDHEGKLPLHEAVWCNASIDVVRALLCFYPQGIHIRDLFGRTPIDLNRLRSGDNKDEVYKELKRGVKYWEDQSRTPGPEEDEAEESGSDRSMDLQDAFRMDDVESQVPPSRGLNRSYGQLSVTSSVEKQTAELDRCNKLSDFDITVPTSAKDRRGKMMMTIKESNRKSMKLGVGKKQSLSTMPSKSRKGNKVHELEKTIAELYTENERLTETVEEMRHERAQFQKELKKDRRTSRHETNLVTLRADIAMLEDENSELKRTVSSLEQRNALYKVEVDLLHRMDQTSKKSREIAEEMAARREDMLKASLSPEPKATADGWGVNEDIEAHIKGVNEVEHGSEGPDETNAYCRKEETEGINLADNVQDPRAAIAYLEDQNKSLQETVNELTESNSENLLQIERLTLIVDAMNVHKPSTEAGREQQQHVGSAERTQGDILTDSAGADAKANFDALVEALESQSRFATERFLAAKVRELEEKLCQAIEARKTDADVYLGMHEKDLP